MEVESVDAGNKGHLKNVLSETELSNLPNVLVNKINAYIEEKFEEYLTSKALHEASKSQIDAFEATISELTAKYEEAAKKLLAAEETIVEFGKQIESLNSELEKANEKIFILENEAISLKSSRDAAIDERNDLTRILNRGDETIERLTSSNTSISQQLQSAIDAKCGALTLNDEIQRKELSLQYREKRMEQERALFNSQISGLTEEVTRLTSELQTLRNNNGSKLFSVETQLFEKIEELNVANESIAQLNEVNKNITARAESLTQRLMEQREIENKVTENYKKELDAKSKLADVFKNMYGEAEAKTMELTSAIADLQKLLNEASEKYGVLETKYNQAELEHEELNEKNNEIIASLKSELEHANDLWKVANAQNLDLALSELAPSAVTASKLLKSGMSFTQIYSELVKVTEELAQEKEESRGLKKTVNTIVQELEEKAPLLQKQKAEYEEAIELNSVLTQQKETILIECNRLRDDYNDSVKMTNHYSKENIKLKGELGDLGRQVCFLLKEIEQTRGNLIVNGDHDTSQVASNTTNSSETSLSETITKALVTFSDIQELQANNQKMLRLVRELSEKKEELEKLKAQFESEDEGNKIKELQSRLDEFKNAQVSQTKMLNGLLRQRDMFKKLYHDLMKGKRHEVSSVLENTDIIKNESLQSSTMDTLQISSLNPADSSEYKIKYKETEKQLELLKEEYKLYKEENVTNKTMLFEQIDNMKKEITKLTATNSKCASTTEYNNERLKTLQTNITIYKKQIAALEEKNKGYSTTIAKHEVSLQHLRDEIVNAQHSLASAEVQVQNLKMENKLIKETEVRLHTECEILNREKQGQALLLKNLELIKASLERVEARNRVSFESRLNEATRECSALRRRLQEEQDRFRELADHLERQTETAKSRLQEEKQVTDLLRNEITRLKQNFVENNRTHDKIAFAPDLDESTKKIKELENTLSDKVAEIRSLQENLNTAKEHIKQYCDIAQGAEMELKTLNNEYESYKSETGTKISDYIQKLQNLEDKCSELETELSLQGNIENTNNSNDLKKELNNITEELQAALSNNEKYESDLNAARDKIAKLSEEVIRAEEKYTHEMTLHSTDTQTLSLVKEELLKTQNQINELVALKNNAVNKLETEKASWTERQKILTEENEQLSQRFTDLCSQNALLHDQIQALGTQLSVAHPSKSLTESMNESGDDSKLNISINEEDRKSSEQLLQIVKLLRKEKDITMAKFDIIQAETMRLKSQLEITEKQLDDTKLALAAQTEKSEVSLVTVNKQSDILRKVETLNALTDSNRNLREERDKLSMHVEELTSSIKALEEQMTPMQEKITELTFKNETLQSENSSLKADSARWRTRVNVLVDRANKINSEDLKRLQNEMEILGKTLTNKKETIKKLNEELNNVKLEKTKLEEQHTVLLRQQGSLVEENKRLNEELQLLRNELARLTETSTKLNSELNEAVNQNDTLSKELTNTEATLNDIKNKENQIRKIAKKYKIQFEELSKTVEEDKKKSEGEAAAADAASAENTKKTEEQINELQTQLETEKANNDKLKQELETLRTANLDKEEKAKQVLKQAKVKIVQLTELKNTLTRELDESRSRIGSIEQTTRDEQDVRVSLMKSQYEGRFSRLEKERSEAQAERAREVDALLQKVNMLQRQLASQASASKQQASTEKTTTEPPTANIKPMAGVSQQSVSGGRRGGEPPLASIRPMAQVGPTAPAAAPTHDAHTTEYMPASSSRPLPRAALAATNAPPESTQDMDTSEAGMGSSSSSENTAQPSSHAQAPQQAVALVMPRIEQPSGATAASSAAASALPAPAQPTQPLPGPAGGGGAPSSGGVSTSHAPPDARPAKRRLQPCPVTAKRTRVQDFERSVEVEYQVPTSSRCDQDDEGVIVVDSEEDDERCTGTVYRDGEEYENVEQGHEVEGENEAAEGENAASQESPAQSLEAGAQEAESEGRVGTAEPDSEPTPIPQIEAISSGTEPSGTLSLGGNGGDDDSIVPSTPTLYVPRRNDGFGEAVVSPVGAGAGAQAGAGARFTFAEAAASHHDTHADLAASLPPHQPAARGAEARAEGAETHEWDESRADDEAAAVSSQGSEPSSPHQVAEEGREAEASAPPPVTPRRPPPPPHQRWMRAAADRENEVRTRGGRSRGRATRRSH